ncbi:hypothetical protein [Thermaerobacillus caldiproteolyticus]|uniref:Uncharacterized protein n=1 Tax=Thermaerobacillus caldiproteolyticus TaxID=247480 RepID=A0A7V9ZA61_9BACL|nr:hypothetical protein [Anoxybacillus caldiproteolyticus]MBA2876882.1 hypothetical protein [Anoxybacillus caldiproteolyticus]
MNLMDRISQEILSFRTKTNKPPSKIELSEKTYNQLIKEIENETGFKIENEMNYYYGIPLKISNGVDLKIS